MTVEQRMTFSRWFQGLSMAAMAMIALWIGSQIRELTASVQKLSEQIAIVSTEAKRDREDVQELKQRVQVLETGRYR